MALNRNDHDEEDRPRWREADEDDEPRDWEIEPEEEKEDRGGVLGRTHGFARVVFGIILGLILVGGGLALVRGLREWFTR